MSVHFAIICDYFDDNRLRVLAVAGSNSTLSVHLRSRLCNILALLLEYVIFVIYQLIYSKIIIMSSTALPAYKYTQ